MKLKSFCTKKEIVTRLGNESNLKRQTYRMGENLCQIYIYKELITRMYRKHQ
jgi:hypothetical protein